MTSVAEWQVKLQDQLDLALGKIKEYKCKLVTTEEDKKCLEQELDDSYNERDECEKKLKSQLANLREEFEEVQCKYEDYQKTNEAKAEELMECKNKHAVDIEKLEKMCEKMERQVKNLAKEKEILLEKEEELKEIYAKAEEEWKEKCGDLKNRFIELTAHNTKLKNLLDNPEKKVVEVQNMETLSSELQGSNMEEVEGVSQRQSENKSTMTDGISLETESVDKVDSVQCVACIDLEQQLNCRCEEVVSLLAQKEDLERKCEEMDRKMKLEAEKFDDQYSYYVEDRNNVNKRLTAEVTEREKAEQELAEKKAERVVLLERYEERGHQNDVLIVEHFRANKKCEQQEEVIEGLNNRIRIMGHTADEFRMRYDERGHQLETALQTSEDRMQALEKLQDRHDVLKSKLEERDLEFEGLLEEKEIMEQTVRDSTAKCTEMEEITRRCQANADELEERDQSRQSENDDIVQRMECIEVENHRLLTNEEFYKNKYEETVESLETITNNITSLEEKLSQVLKECDTLKVEKDGLKETIDNLTSQNTSLSQDCDEKKEQNEEMEAIKETFQSQCAQLETELSHSKSDIELLETDLKEAKRRNDELKAEKEQLVTEFETVSKNSNEQVKNITNIYKSAIEELSDLKEQSEAQTKTYEEEKQDNSESVKNLTEKCDALEEELVKVRTETTEFENKLMIVEADVEKTTEQNATLSSQLDQKCEEIEVLSEAKLELQKELETAKENQELILEETRAEMEKEKASNEDKYSQLKDEYQTVKMSEDELKANSEILIKSLEDEKVQSDKYEEELDFVNSKHGELEGKYCEVGKLYDEKLMELSKLEEIVEDKNKCINDLGSQLKNNTEDLCAKEAEVENLLERLNVAEGQARERETKISMFTNENDRLNSELEAVKVEKEQLQQCLTDSGADKDKMYTEVTETCSHLRQELDMVNRDKVALEGKLEESEHAGSELQGKLTEKCDECNKLSSLSKDVETEKDNLACKIRTLEEDILVFHTKVKDLEIEKAKINKDNENFGDEIVRLKEAMNQRSVDLEKYESELSEKDIVLKTSENDLTLCQRNIVELQSNIDTLSNDVEKVNKEKVELAKQLDEIQSQRDIANTKMVELEKELENRPKAQLDAVDLQSKLKTVTLERAKLVKKLNRAKEEITDLKQNLSELNIVKPDSLNISTDSLDEAALPSENEAKHELEDTKNELMALREKYKHLEDKIEKDQSAAVKPGSQNAEELVAQLQADLQAKCQVVEELQIKCDQLRTATGKDVATSLNDDEDVQQLKSQVTSLQLYISQLQRENVTRNDPKLLTELTDINSSLNTQVSSLKSLVSSIQDENDQLKIDNAKYKYEEENRRIQEVMIMDRQRSPSYASSPGAGSLNDITEALDMVPANNAMCVQRISSSGDDLDHDSIISMESVETITIKKQTVQTFRGSPPNVMVQSPVESKAYEEMKIKYDVLLKEYDSLRESLQQNITCDEDVTNIWQERYEKSVKEVENLKIQLWEQKDMAASLDKDCQARIAELELEVSFSVKNKGELEEMVKQLESKLNKLENLEKSYDKLEDEKGQVETELSNVKMVHEHEKQKLDQKILDMEETIEAHKTAKCMVEQQLNDRQYEYEQALNKAREQQTESEKSESVRIKELLLQLDETEKTLFDWKEKHRKEVEQNELANLRVQHVMKDRELYENYVQNLEAELAIQRDQIRETIRENRDTLRELGEARQELDFLQTERNCELNQLDGSPTKSSGTWLGFGDDSKVQSGLGPDQDGHKAYEMKHFQLIDELKTLESHQKQQKELYESQLSHLREEMERKVLPPGEAGTSEAVVELQEEATALRMKLASLQETNRLLLQEKEDLKELLQKQEQVLSNLQTKVMTLSSSVEIRDVVKREFVVLQTQQTDLMGKLTESDVRERLITDLTTENQALQDCLKEEKEVTNRLLKERDMLQVELKQRGLELSRAKLEAECAREKLQQKDKKEHTLVKDMQRLSSQLREARDKELLCIRSHKDEMRSLQKQVRYKDGQLLRYKEQFTDLRKRETNLRSQHQREMSDFRARLDQNSTSHMEILRTEADRKHREAVERLKRDLDYEFQRREIRLKERHSSDLAAVQRRHQQQVSRFASMMVRVGGGWDTLEHYLSTHQVNKIVEMKRPEEDRNFLYVTGSYKSPPEGMKRTASYSNIHPRSPGSSPKLCRMTFSRGNTPSNSRPCSRAGSTASSRAASPEPSICDDRELSRSLPASRSSSRASSPSPAKSRNKSTSDVSAKRPTTPRSRASLGGSSLAPSTPPSHRRSTSSIPQRSRTGLTPSR